ncbi:hypothetical protein JOF53_000033 [Crossiella equi]|uniref:DNA recombination-mediator protein A n=1 Tax=Crossiella equi TaxID=130796 RepID=A0ABS5A3Q0_9PSEU|nr:hypothetical protein [Crossiella equi]MBP2471161.1 hypothetical protein [Crossiella equi]
MTRFVTITGPRDIEQVPQRRLVELFEAYLAPFATAASHFYLGGAAGIDTVALGWLAEHSHAELTVVAPARMVDQPEVAQEEVTRLSAAGRLAELVELGAAGLGRDAFHARNRWMVDRSSLVVGFPMNDDPASGTWYTLNYGAEQGTARLVVPL